MVLVFNILYGRKVCIWLSSFLPDYFCVPCAALNCYMTTVPSAEVTHQHTDPSSCGLPLSRVDVGSASTTLSNTRLPRNREL